MRKIPRARAGRASRANTATAPTSIRLGWSDGGIVALWFTAKSKSKSSVAVQHTKLPDKETADRVKRYWAERLEVLSEMLEAKAS